MARVRCYRGIRYAPERVRLERVLAPPYDILSPAEREALARDPHNVVHLELPEDEDGPGSRYEAAGRRWRAWQAEGVVRADHEPALYVYRQRFRHEGIERERLGFFALVELLPGGERSGIHPHEFTLRGPREDRLRLLQATRVNLSPVFLLYDDDEGAVRERLAAALPVAAGDPLVTPWGTEEELAALSGLPAEEIAGAVSGKSLVFADGHHRYESALQHHLALHAPVSAPGDASAEAGPEGAAAPAPDPVPDGSSAYALAVFVERGDPGLLVLPTHRVLRRSEMARGEAWERAVGEHFERRRFGHEGGEAGARAAAAAWLAEGERAGACRMVTAWAGEAFYGGLELRRERRSALFAGLGVPAALQEADVEVLHALLERGLGISIEAIRERQLLSYTRDAGEALAAVAAGAPAAFLINVTPVRTIVELAAAGHRLPQKTSYFHPKLTSGWLFHRHPPEAAETR